MKRSLHYFINNEHYGSRFFDDDAHDIEIDLAIEDAENYIANKHRCFGTAAPREFTDKIFDLEYRNYKYKENNPTCFTYGVIEEKEKPLPLFC